LTGARGSMSDDNTASAAASHVDNTDTTDTTDTSPMDTHPQMAEDIDADADVVHLAKEAIDTWKQVDLTQIEVKEMSGLGGSKTFRLSIRQASSDTVPSAIAFHSRSELNSSTLEERNIAAGRAFAIAGVGPMLIAEAGDFRWCINEWAGEAIVEKYFGPGSQSEAAGVAAAEKMTIWSHAGELREHAGRLLGRVIECRQLGQSLFSDNYHSSYPTSFLCWAFSVRSKAWKVSHHSCWKDGDERSTF